MILLFSGSFPLFMSYIKYSWNIFTILNVNIKELVDLNVNKIDSNYKVNISLPKMKLNTYFILMENFE